MILKTISQFVEEIEANDTISNDDEIGALYDQINLRDEAISRLYEALEEHYADSSAASLTRMTIDEYNEFVNGVYHEEDDDEIT
jgi:hypothetical protein